MTTITSFLSIAFITIHQPQTFVVAALVADAGSGAPLAGAVVELPARNRIQRADSSGEVRFEGLESGYVRITARRLGYAPATANVFVGPADTSVVVFLMTLSSTLDTVRVTGAAIPSYLKQFEVRRRIGFGHFLTAAQLDSVSPEILANVVADKFTGLRVEWSSNLRSVRLRSARGPTSLQRGSCYAQVFVDGRRADGDDLISLRAGDVAGVEYYANAAPVEFSQFAPCGVLLIWTKKQ